MKIIGLLLALLLPLQAQGNGEKIDRKTADGRPLVIHNIGAGAQEEDSLLSYPLTGHYRWR